MSLSAGIVGLPNVGKSTLFNALTRSSVPAENYPFCTIDPSVGIVPVPDYRLETLSKISKSEKTIPAIIEFVDIAGLVRGASTGEGLGNKFLANIREVDMIVEVVRIFEDENIMHVSGAVDPLADIEVVNLELILADIESVSKRSVNLQREAKRGEKTTQKQVELLAGLLAHLESGMLAHTFHFDDSERLFMKQLQLLTMKPFLYVFNKKQGAYNFDEVNDGRWDELMEFIETTGSEYVVVDAGVEHELKDLEENEKIEFRREYTTLDSGIDSLITGTYKRLNLISYFTTGEKETHAWTILNGSTGPEAGSAIHTDFQERYIRAQVVSFENFVLAGSMALAREKGNLRTEGKEYIVKDGDIIEFMIA